MYIIYMPVIYIYNVYYIYSEILLYFHNYTFTGKLQCYDDRHIYSRSVYTIYILQLDNQSLGDILKVIMNLEEG